MPDKLIWHREPLVHFLLLGLLLFVVFAFVGEEGGATSDSRIVVGVDDVGWLRATWERQWRRAPTEEELRRLIENFIREEILYREAVALGLDRDDTIVRRRLVQKMEFLSEDLVAQAEPSEEELAAFFSENAERYRVPPRISFSHVYFSRDSRGDAAGEDAERLLAELQAAESVEKPWTRGDRFMLQYEYARKSPEEVGQLFGRDFSALLFALDPGRWQGPVESGYGLHLVLVRDRIPSRSPELAEVRGRVERDLLSERRREANDRLYETLRERYTVELEEALLDAGSFPVEGAAGEVP